MPSSRPSPTSFEGGAIEAGREPDVELTLPAVAESVSIARHTTLGLLDDLEVTDGRLREIALALSEAVTNAIVHGAGDGSREPLVILMWRSDDELTVVVRDEGGGVTPRITEDREGLGLGLPLVISIAQETRFVRRGQTFDVVMRFELAAEDSV